MMKRGSKTNNAFKEQLKGQSLTFQISSKGGVVRHYIIKESQVSSRTGKIDNPSFDIFFLTSGIGFTTLMSKNIQTAFMQGIKRKNITVSGDVYKVM